MDRISGLYLVTYNHDNDLLNKIERSLKGGVDIVEYMDNSKNNIETGKKIRELCNKYNKKLTVFNDIELMKKINADGIHFSNDTSLNDIKKYRILYKDKIFGVSVHCSKEMALKYQDYLNYISTGLCYKSKSNKTASVCCFDLLKNLDGIKIPVFAVGGINDKNIDELLKYKISGVVIVSYIMDSINPEENAIKIKNKLMDHNL